eukprot:CAMPEP_0178921526 /NCGR_PEP_ID=MMETSP0786-20121207/15613_1 /TAXON_ID=186022 /ORGANISM="Thalassionema frauenfeldii, Strain CCMP 1798" /LENGTH=471 /DNA_ID=CAMNT_0020595721 /DNA_START=104 /DNA_END=1519 /DNA_ORIENTATION=+
MLVEGSEDSKTCHENEGSCSPGDLSKQEIEIEPNYMELLQEAVANCKDMQCVLTELITDEFFREDCWETQPVFLHTKPGTFGKGKLTWKTLLDLTDEGLMWGDKGENCIVHPDVKNGTAFKFDARFKGAQMTRQQLEVLKDTIHISSIQAIHRGAAELVLHFQRALGLAANGNVFATKGVKDTPLHTDRAEIFVVQTSGRKRWRVYQPHTQLPVWGVHGDGDWGKNEALPSSLVGDLVLDKILEPGDILYIPRGFPRSATTLPNKKKNERIIDVSIVMHTEGLHLVFEKYMRCALARSGTCDVTELGEKYCPLGRTLTEHTRSEEGKPLRQSLPIGFLSGAKDYWPMFAKKMADTVQSQLAMVLKKADKKGISQEPGLVEKLDSELATVAGRVFETAKADIKVLEEKGWYGNNEDVAFYEKQKHWRYLIKMSGPFQGTYCHENGIEVAFRDYSDADLPLDRFTKMVKKTKK